MEEEGISPESGKKSYKSLESYKEAEQPHLDSPLPLPHISSIQ